MVIGSAVRSIPAGDVHNTKADVAETLKGEGFGC
jgi:hypothetical protein